MTAYNHFFINGDSTGVYEWTGEFETFGDVKVPIARLVWRIQPLAEIADRLLAERCLDDHPMLRDPASWVDERDHEG